MPHVEDRPTCLPQSSTYGKSIASKATKIEARRNRDYKAYLLVRVGSMGP